MFIINVPSFCDCYHPYIAWNYIPWPDMGCGRGSVQTRDLGGREDPERDYIVAGAVQLLQPRVHNWPPVKGLVVDKA